MPKKEGKKATKKKKKGKEKDNKSDLSNREREIYLLTIADLKHKIEWRKHMSSVIEEDLKLFNEKLHLQQEDKTEAIKLLEDSIEEQRGLTEKIQRALPDAESAKSQGEDKRARDLAAKLLQINQERLSNDAELEVLRKKLYSLESYSSSKINEKIKDVESQLNSEDVEDVFLKTEKQDIRRKETFKKEMEAILQKEADSFQIEISGKLDKNFERITEETRWWKDTVNGLRMATERLEAINDIKSANLLASKKELEQRKEMSLQESQLIQEGEANIRNILRNNKQLDSEKIKRLERQKNVSFLDSIANTSKQKVDDQNDYLMTCWNELQMNETEIKDLEEKLTSEISFGNQLKDYIEKAKQLIMEDVKQSLVLTYDGPPPNKKTVQEMRCLFEEATRFIYERENKSLI